MVRGIMPIDHRYDTFRDAPGDDGVHRIIYIIGRFFTIRASQSNIYGMAGGVGDLWVHGADTSQLIMKNTGWREVILAASVRDGICMDIYNN
jgi:hypothetical protein